jgi:quinol monooxygenase YgiN
MMISMKLKIVTSPHQTVQLVHALRLQMSRTETQPGCIQCILSQDPQEQNIIFYEEAWKGWKDIEKNIRSERFSWILQLMELSIEKPDLSFCDIHETRGMEYVKKLRTTHVN